MRRADWRKYKSWPEYFSPDGLPSNPGPRTEDGELDIPEKEYDPDDLSDDELFNNKEEEE